jgi:hypothetical protein
MTVGELIQRARLSRPYYPLSLPKFHGKRHRVQFTAPYVLPEPVKLWLK